MKSYFKIILGGALIVSLFAFTPLKDKYFEISKNIEIFSNLYKELNTYYVDVVDPAQLMRTGIDAMLGSLDPFTNYISESQIEHYRFLNQGKYDGVGARIRTIGKYVTIIEPYEGSAAHLAGLKAGDQIISINGQSAEGKTNDDVILIMRGVSGTDIDLEIKRPGEASNKSIKLVRGEVTVPNVPYSGMVKNDVGYVVLNTFTANAGNNIRKAVRKMQEENSNLKGVVLDLRGNGGGLLSEAVSLCNVFVEKGIEVVSTRSKRKEWDKSYKTPAAPLAAELPLVVLINKRSASASEIVSGVMQDLDRGVVMGQRSYGKGLVQNTKELGYNSRLKITIAKYYIPSGRCIQSVKYENGEPVDIPDNERTSFKTLNGRTVLDGGGVSPDVVLEIPHSSALLSALEEEGTVFNYVTQYLLKNPEITDAGTFEFDDFQSFRTYCDSENFNFESKSEKELKSLMETLSKDKFGNASSQKLKELSAQLEQEKMAMFDTDKGDIINMIELDIAARLGFQNGKIARKLLNDNELSSAIALLNNPAEYKKILNQ